MPFELLPHKLVYGGDALGYHQGQAVFVPRALPGERVEVEAVRRVKGVVHARPLKILTPAPERIVPPCPYFGPCGGCQYQHLSVELQTSSKREILRETLRRTGKIIWESDIPVHAAVPWNYRNQAQIKVARKADGRMALGFFEPESHRLFPVDVCLILSPRLNLLLAELSGTEWSERLARCQEIELLADDRDERVMITLHGAFAAEQGEALAKDCLARLRGAETVAFQSAKSLRVFGKGTLDYHVGEFRYRISPGSFFQASRFLLPSLAAAAMAGEPAIEIGARKLEKKAFALDLFAGVGLFTLPLARRFEQVVAVEANAQAVADLVANADAHALTNVRAVTETAFDFLRRCARPEPDCVVIDPPRAGAGTPALKLLAGLRPRRIHYVSCHPPTLARDLGYLLAQGYEIYSIELFDFFPHTYHIECLARLARRVE